MAAVSKRLLLLPALVASLALLASACDEPGRPFDCRCKVLTDFDDALTQDELVCAPNLERAAAVARGCAQSSAPAPVQGCSCRPVEGAACVTGKCFPRPAP